MKDLRDIHENLRGRFEDTPNLSYEEKSPYFIVNPTPSFEIAKQHLQIGRRNPKEKLSLGYFGREQSSYITMVGDTRGAIETLNDLNPGSSFEQHQDLAETILFLIKKGFEEHGKGSQYEIPPDEIGSFEPYLEEILEFYQENQAASKSTRRASIPKTRL